MKILVTGGAGYIGSVTVYHLINAGHQVTVYDNLSRGHRIAIPAGASFVQGDIGHRETLDKVLDEGFEAIIHFAAFIEAGESMEKPGIYFRNNVCASQTLIEAATEYAVPNFVFSSSAAVYAGSDRPLVETDPIQPSNVYGQSKRMVEEMLHWTHRLKELQCCILRYFNASGASLDGQVRGEDHHPETHLIPLVLQVALGQREKISIYGDDYPTADGTNVRDYIHVDDLAQAHVLAVEAMGRGTLQWAVYNLGNERGYSNKEVLAVARKITDHPIPAVMSDRRPGDAATLIARSDKIRNELGWKPRYPDLKTIVESAWKWHYNYPQGYEDR